MSVVAPSPVLGTGGASNDGGSGRPPLVDVHEPPADLLRLILGAEKHNDWHRELAAAISAPGVAFFSLEPAVVESAMQMRRGPPHQYVPLLTAWQLPVRSAFVMFERQGREHGVQVEILSCGLTRLRHVGVSSTGYLQQPVASTLIECDAQRPFVHVDELPPGLYGQRAEAGRIWMGWFHSIVTLAPHDLPEERQRQWVHWLLDDLAVLAIALSDAVMLVSCPVNID